MNFPLAILTVASALQVTPYAEPPPGGTRVVMFTLPQGQPTITEPIDDQEVVFYFAEPVRDAETIATAPAPLVDDADPEVVGLPCPLHATLRSLGRWLLVLLSMVFVAALLGSVGATRRPLPLAAIAVRQPSRPVPLLERLLVLACLWSPMLMLLGLLQAEREMLSSVLLCMAVTGVLSSAAMLASRRRLAARLRWALEARLGSLPAAGDDPTMVKAEVEPRRLVPPPGDEGPTPWFRADLLIAASEPGAGRDEPASFARVSLDGLIVDDEAARTLVKLAMGQAGASRLTVLGCAHRAPADAASAQPLDRHAPTQARIGSGAHGRALLVGGSPAALARRLRSESLLLAGALAGSLSAAILTLLN
jgi:hypothetical protein